MHAKTLTQKYVKQKYNDLTLVLFWGHILFSFDLSLLEVIKGVIYRQNTSVSVKLHETCDSESKFKHELSYWLQRQETRNIWYAKRLTLTVVSGVCKNFKKNLWGHSSHGGSIGVLGSAGTAGGWVFGAGKCRGIAIWVPANAGHAGLRKHF